MAASRRAKIIYKLAQLIAERAAELALIEVRDNGKTIATAKGEMSAIVDTLRVLCRRGDEELRRNASAADSDVSREHGTRAGRRRRRDRAVELSAAARILEGRAGARGGMHDRPQAVIGDAADGDRAWEDRARSRHSRRRAQRAHRFDAPDRRVDGASIRESTRSRSPVRRQTGKSVAAAAAKTLKRVTLELGGKSPSVVFDDADLDAAVAGALYGVYYNAGQCCEARTRILVQSGIYDRFVRAFIREGKTAARRRSRGPGDADRRDHVARSIRKDPSLLRDRPRRRRQSALRRRSARTRRRLCRRNVLESHGF